MTQVSQAPIKEGDIIESGPFAGFEVISVYTRAQALEDGVLENLSELFPGTVQRFFKLPLACTTAVWHLMERAANDNTACDIIGIVGYVAMLAWRAARYDMDDDIVFFDVTFKDTARKPYQRKLKLHIGGGDNGEPVLTLMMHDED